MLFLTIQSEASFAIVLLVLLIAYVAVAIHDAITHEHPER